MMRFDYDPKFVEQSTFLAARRDPRRECELHEILDPIYRIDDSESRLRAFRQAYGELFRSFGLDEILPSYVQTFRLVSERLGRCVVREAERARSQNVDLYREKLEDGKHAGDRIMIIALCPECFLDRDRLGPWLYRQLQHVQDMVDEKFAYERTLPDVSRIHQNLIRDRYSVLWDIFVESRLIRSGTIDGDGVEKQWMSFSKAFSLNGKSPSRAIFEELLKSNDLIHVQLLAWASDPGSLMEGERTNNDRIAKTEDCLAA